MLLRFSFVVCYGADWSSCYKGYCYHRSLTTFTSWSQCRDYCLSLGTDLVSIHSEAENTFIYSVCHMYQRCAHGLNDAETTNRWVWTDGSAFDYSNWCSGQPGSTAEHYAYFVPSNAECWHDVTDVTVDVYALCKRVDTSPSISPTTGPSTALPSNKPTVGPSTSPTYSPTVTFFPQGDASPSTQPSISPTAGPSTALPSNNPTVGPSTSPSYNPTVIVFPEGMSTLLPTRPFISNSPTVRPSISPTYNPTVNVYPDSSAANQEGYEPIDVLGVSMSLEAMMIIVILVSLLCCLCFFMICASFFWLQWRKSNRIIKQDMVQAINMSHLERPGGDQSYKNSESCDEGIAEDHASESIEMFKPNQKFQPTSIGEHFN